MKTIAIIGGGASGLTAAIFTKRTNPAAEVTVFEGGDRVARKIHATGNGRCNLSNVKISDENYISSDTKFLKIALEGHGFGFARSFFASLGIPFAVEDGRAYPLSMRAASVADALRFECTRRGVEICTSQKITDIKFEKGLFKFNDKSFNKLILACGGRAAPMFGSDGSGLELARSFGHKIVAPRPALVRLYLKKPDKSLKGLRVRANASAVVDGNCVREELGEIQFNGDTLSGIPIMQLSPLFNDKMNIVLDLFPKTDFTSVVEELLSMAEGVGDLPLPEFMGGYFPKSLTRRVCNHCGIEPAKPAAELTVREIKRFVSAAKSLKFEISGTGSWNDAQCTCGGVSINEISPETMQSRILGGLYFTGEIMDVCGDCGGYNLHWAWVSGARAGEAAATE